MKSLRDYKLTLTKTPAAEHQEGIAWTGTYATPLFGEVNGLPVRILNIGNLPGASPVYNCVDRLGFSTAVKQADVTITDGAALPLITSPTK